MCACSKLVITGYSIVLSYLWAFIKIYGIIILIDAKFMYQNYVWLTFTKASIDFHNLCSYIIRSHFNINVQRKNRNTPSSFGYCT